MTWIAIKVFFLKVWAWCKRYWQLLVGAAIPITLWIFFRFRDKSGSRAQALSEVVERVNNDHRQEIAVINESEKIEREKIVQAQARRDETVAEIESEYAAASIELDEKKKKSIQRLVKRHEKDPDALTQELARLTGARVWTGKRR